MLDSDMDMNTRVSPSLALRRYNLASYAIQIYDGDALESTEDAEFQPHAFSARHSGFSRPPSPGDEPVSQDDGNGIASIPRPDPGSLDDIESQERQDQSTLEGEPAPTGPIHEDTSEPTVIHLADLKISQEFIERLRSATLETTRDADLLRRLRHPPTSELHLDNPIIRQSLEIYLEDITEAAYERMRASLQHVSGITLLSHARIKKVVEEISGVVPMYNDMCVKGCLAFVGPFAQYSRCPKCGEQRYDPYLLASKHEKKPRQQFVTIPVGPQIQAAYRSVESATDMNYRAECTRAVMADIAAGGAISEWADYIHGTSYLEAALANDIKDTTTVLMGSLDGAQLYRMKTSDCWIYIWVLLDRSPGTRYKKKHVLVGGVIPGPDKPGNIDSFLFPGLYHLSALMREGLTIWDARRDILFISHPFLAFMTADGPGMTEVNGLVGHSGAQGCRLYCGIKGHHKPDVGHYYPACLKPNDYAVEGCSHDDVQLDAVTSPGLQNNAIDRYEQNLKTVLSSVTQRSYRQNRLATGISKPSIISGLPPSSIFSIPGCFPGDLMHLAALNIPDLLLALWRGTITCDRNLGDDKLKWDWAIFQDDVLWKRHGAQVAAATPYLPGSFDRPPRNPAEKLTSGYKAMEFLTYIYGLGPGLLYGVLPMPYWKSFCKLVRGVRVVHQKTIKSEELTEADKRLLQFCIEFEQLYYQRNPARIHFVRQSIHALSHLASETTRIGPYAGVAQWTMENTIGNLGREIHQPSNAYANLSQRAVRRCQVNAIKAMLPELETPKSLPQGAEDLGTGYVLLPRRERIARPVSSAEASALREFIALEGIAASNDWLACPSVSRWARVRLPTGQVARSLWKEEATPLTKLRMSRNVKVQGLSFQCIYILTESCR